MAGEVPVVPPREALDFFRNKGLAVGFAWQDVWQEEHARAFTVAKAMSRDLLEDIRAAVDKAIAEGETLDMFRKQLRPLLEKRGWWGRRSMVDPLTGEQKVVQLGSPRRLKTIFEVNMRSAHAAGRWERAQRVAKGFPFLRYVTAGDSRVRAEHRAWHGVIRPQGDVFWETHYPPCGWSCRCTAVPVSGSMLERRGWQVTEDPPSFPKVRYINPRTGEVVSIEQGIDPGFNFNVGKARLRDLAPPPVPTAPLPSPAPVALTVDELDADSRDALTSYTGSDFKNVNNHLRGVGRRGERGTREAEELIARLDRAFEKARLPEPTTVYRGCSRTFARTLLKAKLKPGDPFVDAGFVSTSRSAAYVKNNFADELLHGSDRIIIKIFAPAGTRAFDISSVSGYPKEKEVLFARSTRMRVKRWLPDKKIFELEVLLDE